MRTIVDDVMEKLPELFSMRELMGKVLPGYNKSVKSQAGISTGM